MNNKTNRRKVKVMTEVEAPLLEPADSGDDAPNVVAYRVKQLEGAVVDMGNTIKLGLKEHNDKLDKLANNFATKTEVDDVAKRVSSLESDRRWLVYMVFGSVLMALLSLVLHGNVTK